MTELLLVGASGLAREVLSVLRTAGDRRAVAILDDAPELHGATRDGVPVVGGIDAVRDYDGSDLLLCVGRGTARNRIAERMARLGARHDQFVSVIHPSVAIPDGCDIGHGSIVLAGAVLTASVRVGRHVVVMPNATLTHDDVVEDFATLCAGVSLGGEVRVGRAAYLGMNSSVRERVTVGAESTLGMGAALLSDLPAGETWVGVPARPVGHASR